jgi:hypothetical protein
MGGWREQQRSRQPLSALMRRWILLAALARQASIHSST